MAQNRTDSIFKEYASNPEFQSAMTNNEREYRELFQMSLYSDLEKIQKLRTFQKLQGTNNGDTVYAFYGMFLPRYKKYQDKVFLTLIKLLERQLPNMKTNYSIIFFNSLCDGYDAYMGFKNMLKRFPQKYFQKLSKVYIVHPEKSLTPVQWLSFGIVNKFINKITVFIKKIEELGEHGFNPSYLHVTLPKQIITWDNKQSIPTSQAKTLTQKQVKEQSNKMLSQYQISDIGLPTYLKTLLSYFEAKPQKLKIEGIFRKNGSVNDINSLSKHVSRKNYQVLFLMQDPHPVCALIKNFFTTLSQPLFSYLNYQQILNKNVDQYDTLAFQILKNIPIIKYKILLITLGFMIYRVVTQQKYNKMSIYNVAVCLTPCFFKPKQYKNQDFVHTPKFVAFLMKIMSNFPKYFSSKDQNGKLYRQEAAGCVKQLKRMLPKFRKSFMSNNLQSKIPSKPSRMNFYAENQQQQ